MDEYRRYTGSTLDAFYTGWETYQNLLIDALTPLTPEELALHAGNELRTIEGIARHMIGARARWMHAALGDDASAELDTLRRFDAADAPSRTAEELVSGLQTTWGYIRDAVTRWPPDHMAAPFTRTRNDQTYTYTRQWVIWHLIEHDLHHGGEISLTLGMHGLAAPDL
jgi:uncharacterized damage-inducible protein DinB